MARLQIRPGGVSGGFVGSNGGKAGKRSVVRGWSLGSAQRLLRFLWSVNPDALDRRDGWALTLTLGETPATSATWQALRKAYSSRVRDLVGEDGFQFWVVEWTAKGRPHLHMAVYGGDRQLGKRLLLAWLQCADRAGFPVNTVAQHIIPITGATGWLNYVSKHASRGVEHYQRQGAPEGWDKTGRLWGHSEGWPVETPLVVDLEDHQFHHYRRLVRDYRRRELRRAGAPESAIRRVGASHGHNEKGRFQGVGAWLPDVYAMVFLQVALAKEATIKYEKDRVNDGECNATNR
jgi:hypothetical protein